jgi:hypothetical protein
MKRKAILVAVAVSLAVVGTTGCAQHSPSPTSDVGLVDAFRSVLATVLAPADLTPGKSSQGPWTARLAYRDERGSGELEAALAWRPDGASGTAIGCPDRAYSPFDRCSSRTLPDKSLLTVDEGFANPVQPRGVKVWDAMLTTQDGHQITVTARNAQSDQAKVPTRDTPPLTTDQLSAAVSSERWQAEMAKLPQPPTPPAPPFQPEFSQAQMLQTLRRLLPRDLRVADEAGSAKGYVDVTVDDGRGKALLTVNVQKWQAGVSQLGSLFIGARRMSDGVLVQSQEIPTENGSGGVDQEIDVLYPDRWRVDITEYNSSAYGLPVTRYDLPLTAPELTQIALDSGWRQG